MKILNNAIDSIILGLEDYKSDDPRRLLSCTRNIFSGILLLFKYKLSLLSPTGTDESLIKQRVLPTQDADGNIIWEGKGKKTVDVQQISERLESLGVDVEWRRVNEINKFRNDIEHYYSNLSTEAVQSLISNSFIVIRDFITKHLGLDPKDLLEEEWETLVSVSEVYQKEKEECVNTLETIDWISPVLPSAVSSYKCDNCGSDLITVVDSNAKNTDIQFSCRTCDAIFDYETVIEESLSDYYGAQWYLHHTDGESLSLIDCPHCSRTTYLFEERVCAACTESAEHTCQRCFADIIPEEINEDGYCSWCLHMMSKDD